MFVCKVDYSFLTKVRIAPSPKLFFLFFENHYLFPFFYSNFAERKSINELAPIIRNRHNNY